MKKTLLAALVALATIGTAAAQTKMAPVAPGQNPPTMDHGHGHGKGHGHKTPEQKADHRAAKLAKELGLNADQEAKVEAILLAENKEMMALHSKATPGARGEMTPEMKAARDKYDAELKTVLTPAQFAKLQAERTEHRGEMKGKRAGKMKVKD